MVPVKVLEVTGLVVGWVAGLVVGSVEGWVVGLVVVGW